MSFSKDLKAISFAINSKKGNMLEPAEEIKNALKAQQKRSSSRERTLTQKGQELQNQEAKKKEKTFCKAYEAWKLTAKGIRAKLKTLCSPEDLEGMQRDVKNKHDRVCQHYELIKGNRIISPDVKKMDACSILSSEICDNGGGGQNTRAKKRRWSGGYL